MAGAARSALPPPLALLVLLVLSRAPPVAGTKTITVQVPTQVFGYLGESVLLPCHLQLLQAGVQVTQVTWMKQELAGNARSVAVFRPTREPSFLEPERMKFMAITPDGDVHNASLLVSELRMEDEASYTCEFAMFPMGSGSASTWLGVRVKPQNTAEALEVPLSPPTSKFVPVASCVSTGGRPLPRVTWSSRLNGSVSQSQAPGPLPGTFTVTSLFSVVPSSQADGENVTCVVEYESVKVPLPVTLAVHYPPEVSISGNDGNWYVGRTEATLTCRVRSNPEPMGYNWSTTTGPLPRSAEAQGAQLLIHTVDESINTTFICRVTNALGTSQAEVSILVREDSYRKRSHAGVVIAGVFVGTSVLIALALLYFKPFRRCGRPSPSVNGDVHYSSVHVSSPQDTPTNAR